MHFNIKVQTKQKAQYQDRDNRLYINIVLPYSTDIFSFFLYRTVQPCSSVPTNWTRRTFLGNPIPSWSSTEAMKMARKCPTSICNCEKNISHDSQRPTSPPYCKTGETCRCSVGNSWAGNESLCAYRGRGKVLLCNLDFLSKPLY